MWPRIMPCKIADPIQKFMAPEPMPNGLQAADDGPWYNEQSDDHIVKPDWDMSKVIYEAPAESIRSGGITVSDVGNVWVSDASLGIGSRFCIEEGLCCDAFSVPHPVQIHGMNIKDNVLWCTDDRCPIGILSVSMEPDF